MLAASRSRHARPCCATPSRWPSLARRLDWPASSLWSKASLVARFGEVPLLAGPRDLPLSDFYAYADNNGDDAPIFVFDRSYARRAPAMLDEYDVPAFWRGRDLFDLLGEKRPDFRWLLIGNRRSGSKWRLKLVQGN